jgi:hypothetical protein
MISIVPNVAVGLLALLLIFGVSRVKFQTGDKSPSARFYVVLLIISRKMSGIVLEIRPW